MYGITTKPGSASGGYTLIEVLVAFMIVVMVFSVFARLFSSGMRNVSASADYARGVVIAESILADIGTETALSPFDTSGTEDGKYHWTVTVREFAPHVRNELQGSAIAAYRVSVVVEWDHESGTRNVSLSTVKLSHREAAES